MTTRLDRLLLLLDTGSTPIIRRTAAQQLGEVQKLHPHELQNLLKRVHVYLKSSNWDTRIAAGEAIEAIASNVPNWEPVGLQVKAEKEPNENITESNKKDALMFDQFDITHVLKHGEALLGSSGQEYDVFDEELLGLDVKERLSRQQDILRRRLGLVPGVDSGMDILLDDEDILPAHAVGQKTVQKQKSKDGQSTADLVAAEIAAISSSVGMSSREKNKAKRRAKILAKQRSKDNNSPVGISTKEEKEGPPEKKFKHTAQVVVDQPEDPDKIVIDSVRDTSSWFEEEVEWPFTTFCQDLCHELFHPSWEVRHGAATGLRHIIRIHGTGAGKRTDTPNDEMESANELWLEDMSLKLLCVFALDRFGDFVTDEVVAPVRETCAQTLGVVIKHMKASAVKSILNILLTLQAQQEWQVRHGGLLGIKYLLAVRKDMTEQLLPVVLDPLIGGLEDNDDDVRAVSAAALLPVVEEIILIMSDKIPTILSILWDSLSLLDDLSASTSSILMLLATIVSSSVIQSEEAITGKQGESLSSVVPRLWPFLRHNIFSVRRAALQTLRTILETHKRNSYAEATKKAGWLLPILEAAMRHLFERFLVEQVMELLTLLQEVWRSMIGCVDGAKVAVVTAQWVNIWLSMAMYPKSASFNPAWIIHTPVQHKDGSKKSVATENIGGVLVGKSPSEVDSIILQARRESSRALGFLGFYLSEAGDDQSLGALDLVVQCLHGALSSTSGAQYMVTAMVISEWAALSKDCVHLSSVVPKLTTVLSAQVVYDEVGVLFTRLQTDCQSLQIAFQEKGIDTSSAIQSGYYTIDSATLLVSSVFNEAVKKLPPKDVTHLESKRRHLVATIGQLQYEFEKHSTRVLSVIAGALVTTGTLPPKLNPIIRPLMDAIKKEEDTAMQQLAACNLTKLLEFCLDRSPCPNSKIVKNLCLFACNDPSATPNVANSTKTPYLPTTTESTKDNMDDNGYRGIVTLLKQNEDKTSGSNSKKESTKTTGSDDLPSSSVRDVEKDEETRKNVRLQRIGAELTLSSIAKHFKASLPEKVPELWNTMIGVLEKNLVDTVDLAGLKGNDSAAQEVVNSLQLLELLAPIIDKTLQEKILDVIPCILRSLQHPYNSVRHMAARTFGILATFSTAKVMGIIMDKLVPLLNATDDNDGREGAIESIFYVTSRLHINVIPYVVLLIIPTLGAMSDHSEHVRLMAAQCFATLISLMPLESTAKEPVQLSKALAEKRDSERHFLKQLFGETKLDNFTVPVPIKAELRKYQQDGVNWLAFLRKYKLHGILCDDMGLGKTLQTICIIAGDHHHKLLEYKKTQNPHFQPLPSLVICPPTLTGHWCYEVEKFIAKEHLNPLHYTGPPTERQRLRHKVKKHNLVVASYDIVRNDSDFFKSLSWNFCVLDEGHIIKNAKTKMSKVIKELKASHRLILSGTPIQNNVLELWSLFDFLMPGFLGSEKKFQAQYGKPILMSRDAKSSSREQEEGALAMESLHRQVLPFLLRRMKEDVLQDLPPKIIQDYYCELSPLQLQLYEDFAKSKAKKEMESSLHMTEDGQKKEKRNGPPHVFQALQYLRKVCNHPALVMTPSHPEYRRITDQLKQQNTSLHDINNASKLVALKQLLQDCGIGVSQTSDDVSSDPVVSQHRVLLFCQFKSMLDIIEQDLLKIHMPSVTYLRLDGGTPAGQRHSIVQRFNDDPSIDVLLLTTHVGGLGLNLTGADTVIFVEHDWNPMKDSQAMDRAHRIGQKKVVNVYRLITRGTLEEKIMGLQKFKLNIANTVITQENSSFASMDTSQVLDLFTVEGKKKEKKQNKQASTSNKTSMAAMLENLEELWDEKQYETEYDLANFMNTLKS